ncbi:hypothetical protein JYB64_11575 [Algoriphagus aestuarii]|nr:hypothetical protein [Algoriphagus aestuarii]
MRICFIIPDGVGIRNYLYSDVIHHLQESGHEVVLWHSLEKDMIELAEKRFGSKFEQFIFEHQPDNSLIQLLRESARYARLTLNSKLKNNPTIMTNWIGGIGSIKNKALMRLAEIVGGNIKTYKETAKLEKRNFKLIRKTKNFKDAIAKLKEINPDLLFCTHQRVFSVTTTMEAAKSLGIPTAMAIFSWDNLPKGRLPFRADNYFVWSNYMKQELLGYYPEISESQISVTGTPQFDFYFKKELILDKNSFATKYGLDPSKDWVCFSGCDTVTSPNDPLYLKNVASSLKGQDQIQLIFRPVPVETIDRFKTVLDQYDNIKLFMPLWKRGNHWSSFFPLFEDIQVLVNLAYHCKVVVNIGSTMALDFTAFGNVGLYLNFDHANTSPDWSVDMVYKFEHFKSMGDLKAVGWINSPDQILPMVKKAISEPKVVSPDNKKWFNKIVQPHPEKLSSLRVAEALTEMIKKPN